jgi:DNA-binding NarL/FixJ family response regulator
LCQDFALVKSALSSAKNPPLGWGIKVDITNLAIALQKYRLKDILIAKGLTNQEIASRLYLSLNTVKIHTRNIYGKLGVNNRTGAVARGRYLGILPSG